MVKVKFKGVQCQIRGGKCYPRCVLYKLLEGHLMTDRPIICRAHDVLAILDGRKTVTRLVIIPVDKGLYRLYDNHGKTGKYAIAPSVFDKGCAEDSNGKYYRPHRIGPGDTLWVREAVAVVGNVDPGWVLYRASGYENECRRYGFDEPFPDESVVGWRSPVHMPRWASRLTLEVVSVRAERLQDITNDDAKREGIQPTGYGGFVRTTKDGGLDQWVVPRNAFREQWDKRHAKHPERQWAANPWVWRVEFLKQRSE